MAVEYNMKVIGNKKQAITVLDQAEKLNKLIENYKSTGDRNILQ